MNRSKSDLADDNAAHGLLFPFFLSGFAALIYQVVWQRSLYAEIGINIESVTLITAVFMLGLGIGTRLGGFLALRFSEKAPFLFILCEVGIGLFGMISLPCIRAISNFLIFQTMPVIALVLFGLLLFPTVLMGATLPLLVEHLNQRQHNLGQSVGALYSVNALGSALACFSTVFVFFVYLGGQQQTIYFAAVCNFTVAILIGNYLKKNHAAGQLVSAEKSQQEFSLPSSRKEIILIYFFAFFSGLISMSQEIIWIRVLTLISGDSPVIFAAVVGLFLLGIRLGARKAEDFCQAVPALEISRASQYIQTRVIACGVCFFVVLLLANHLIVWSTAFGFALSLSGIVAVSYLMSQILPVLCHYAHQEKHAGFFVSKIFSWNIAGSVAGPLLTGFVLFQKCSLEAVILGVSLTLMAAGIWIGFCFQKKNLRGFAMLAAAVLMAGVYPAGFEGVIGNFLFKQKAPKYQIQHIIQNRSGIIVSAAGKEYPADVVYGGGVYDGMFNVDPLSQSNRIDRAYDVAALHPNPESVFATGLATGSWVSVLANYEPVKKIVCVEINPGYLELIRHYAPQNQLLTDPKVLLPIDDGRRWLKRNPEVKFDFILQNTTFHWRSNGTNLVSREYLELLKSHLHPGGVVFMNTTGSEAVIKTAAAVFTYVTRYDNFVAMSEKPFTLTPDEIRANLSKFKLNGIPITQDARPEMASIIRWISEQKYDSVAEKYRKDAELEVITDNNMATEFKRPKWWIRAKHSLVATPKSL